MRIKSIITLLLLPMTLLCQSGDVKVEIERIILHDTEISLEETPGFLIAVIDADTTYYIDFGGRTKDSNDAVLPHDVFEVGSITKVITASLVTLLVDKGIISWQDKVNNHLALEYQNPRMDNLTILDLVQHTSGLPIRPYFFGTKEKDPQNPYGHYEKIDILTFYRDFVPHYQTFNYAHTNYGLLEIVLEHATNTSFDRLIDDYILKPMGMNDSFVFFKEKKHDIVTPGYDRAGRLVDPWTFASFGASEGFRTTMQDLVTFVKVFFDNSNHPYHEILIQNIEKEVQTDFNDYIHTGKGWQIINQKKQYDIITHSGKTSGHHAMIAFVKETQTAVIILSNSSIGTADLGYLILRMINYNWKRKS